MVLAAARARAKNVEEGDLTLISLDTFDAETSLSLAVRAWLNPGLLESSTILAFSAKERFLSLKDLSLCCIDNHHTLFCAADSLVLLSEENDITH